MDSAEMQEIPKVVRIICDNRELHSQVIKELERMGAEVELQTLSVGDYILSNRIGIERKTAEDGINSLIGEEKGKIFRQCRDLAESYQRAVLLFECDLSDLFTRNIHPGAIWGMLRSILWNGCAVEFTYDAKGTAKKLFELAQAEQDGIKKPFSPHGMKTKRNLKEQLEYTVSSINDIGGAKAINLLQQFKSIKGIVNADVEHLKEVDLIGEPTAIKIKEFFGREY